MKIELKRVSFNERMSEETNCFVADLYINGKKVGECSNDGRGGCTDYRGDRPEHYQVIRDAENYFNSLPKVKDEKYNFEFQPSLESAIDDQFEEYLKAKAAKKMEKTFETAICFGVPDGNSYRYISWKGKKPLSTIPKVIIQGEVNRIKANECKNGVVILNTNLQSLGIVL
jgi:hypothetical protein